MAVTLKMKFFLVVLAFGFFTPYQVDGLKCYVCDRQEGTVDFDCKTKDVPCNGTCGKFHTTKPIKSVSHFCSPERPPEFKDITDFKCLSADKISGSNGEEGVLCLCVKDNCNSVGQLQGWTFIQLIAISFVVIIIGVGANRKP